MAGFGPLATAGEYALIGVGVRYHLTLLLQSLACHLLLSGWFHCLRFLVTMSWLSHRTITHGLSSVVLDAIARSTMEQLRRLESLLTRRNGSRSTTTRTLECRRGRPRLFVVDRRSPARRSRQSCACRHRPRCQSACYTVPSTAPTYARRHFHFRFFRTRLRSASWSTPRGPAPRVVVVGSVVCVVGG